MGTVTLANKITLTRIILIPFFIVALVYGRADIALVIFCVAVISDGLDGFIARAYNQRTALGTIIDPVADKLLLVTAYQALAFSPTLPTADRLPPYVPIVVISRDIMIVIGSIVVYLMKGDLKVAPSAIGKITTFFQMMTAVSVLAHFVHARIIWNVTVALTVASGLDYMVRGLRFLNDHPPARKA